MIGELRNLSFSGQSKFFLLASSVISGADVSKILDDRASSQWFANLENVKDDAVKALEEVNFYPSRGELVRLEINLSRY